MTNQIAPYPIIVGGHICLDIIPSFQGSQFSMVPGKLLNIGQAVLATGGAVANTGIALHRLGLPVQLMGKVGNDLFGEAILSIIRNQHEELVKGMIIAEEEASSYSIVLNPPHVDRMFLHCTGANDTFNADDIRMEVLREAGLFHFGYPPLMRRMYEHGGSELAALMKRAKAVGATTSLDMAKPDPDGPAGQVDWRVILGNVLPDVDLFQPSIEEILFMLSGDQYEEWKEKHGSEHMIEQIDLDLLKELSAELLAMGAAVVVLKLGEFGLYMRTTDKQARIANMGRYRPLQNGDWLNRELFVPCFEVDVAGTTGAGDCTIAGFLAGFIKGLMPEEVLIGAVGTGACNVEQPDATSGIPSWDEVQSRIASGWNQHSPLPALSKYQKKTFANVTVYDGDKEANIHADS